MNLLKIERAEDVFFPLFFLSPPLPLPVVTAITLGTGELLGFGHKWWFNIRSAVSTFSTQKVKRLHSRIGQNKLCPLLSPAALYTVRHMVSLPFCAGVRVCSENNYTLYTVVDSKYPTMHCEKYCTNGDQVQMTGRKNT